VPLELDRVLSCGRTQAGGQTLHYPLFDGARTATPICIETFPHAIVCAMGDRVVSSKPKLAVRRAALQDRGYDVRDLRGMDFIDAALCAVTAEEFRRGRYECYGDSAEGYIVVPKAVALPI